MDLPLDLFNFGFLTIRVTDLIDIAIVSLLLYKLYSVMRGTIAAQIFLGLLFIITISFISQILEMRLLSWMLKTVGDIWVIALIILFQPELRRLLLLVGRNGLFTTFEHYDISKTVDVLVESAEELSRRRFGALIVVSRTTDISLSVDTGVPVNAQLSRAMLVSIFNPKSPLHDGAVVVSGEQIESARVILPFSPVMRVADAMLGTRHRAGLGISEQADVFVLIVSEETGYISYAHEGTLFYNKTSDDLRRAMKKVLESDAEQKEQGFIRTVLSRFPAAKTSLRRKAKAGATSARKK